MNTFTSDLDVPKHHAYFFIGLSPAKIAEYREYFLSQVSTDIGTRYTLTIPTLAIEHVRSLKDWASLGGDTKLALVQTSAIGLEASHALLKLLEEPPQGTTLVFFLDATAHILPTIRSRVYIQYSSINSADTDQDIQDFISANHAQRIEIAKNLAEERAQAIDFVYRLSLYVRSPYISQKISIRTRSVISDTLGYIGNRGSSPKQLLERLALCRYT